MKSSHLPHHIVARPQMQVVCVGQFDLRPQPFLQIDSADAALDGGLGAYVHKHRCLHFAAMGTGKHTSPGFSFFFDDLEHFSLLLSLNKHRIAKREEAVPLLHRLLIGRQHVLSSR